MNRKFNWNDREAVQSLAYTVSSVSDLLRAAGLSTAGANFRTAKKWVDHHKIDVSHFEDRVAKLNRHNVSRRRSDDDVFCEQSDVTQRVLRNAVLRSEFIDYVCSKCNTGSVWAGKELTLHLDHINGCSNDNRKENLRWLCPNCHSQTETYAGKNNRGFAKLA